MGKTLKDWMKKFKYQQILLRVIILLVTTIPAYAQYPDINTERPRIYTDAERFSWCMVNHTVPGVFKDDFDDFLYRYDTNWITDPELYLAGSDITLWTWNWDSFWAQYQLFFTVFIYKVSGDPLAFERCKFLARQVVTAVNDADFPSMEFYEKESFLRKISESGGLLLDWCYDDLPTTLRDDLVQALYMQNTEFMNTFILSSEGTSYVSSHNTWNTIICNQNTLVLYNASGLSPSQQDTVQSWFETIYNKLTNEFIPCWTHYRDDDGGWNWGAAYSMWSLTDQFQLFENMKIATDKNFYTDLPWIQNSINQYIYFLQPDHKTIHLGDGVMRPSGADRVMYLSARYYDDPRSKWLSQYWSLPENMDWTPALFDKLLYKDYTAAIVTQPENPLDWWTDKAGLSVSRSSWEDDAVMVTFFNSPSKRAAHEHRDNNSFTIFKDKPLLIDAGHYDAYGSAHYLNYYQRTIAHNTICVYDSTETYTNFGQPVSNDGGQIESMALQNYNDIFHPENQRGAWIQYAAGTNYTYNVADAQLSYDPSKLDFFRRRLLYLKPQKVIVLDHVHLNNVTTSQRDIKWIAHFAEHPEISGAVISTEVAGHIITYNGKDYTAENGNGNVAIRTLLPAGSNTTLIGGAGYEYWVDGTNYPPGPLPDTSFYTPGSWRIEVKPDVIPDDGNVVYLHAVSIGNDTNAAVAGGIALQSVFSTGVDWDGTLYFFAADGGTEKEYHIFDAVTGARDIGIFAVDLEVGTYQIKVNGVKITTQSTDMNGILQTTINLPSGNHTIEIAKETAVVYESEKKPYAIYPNPAHTELNIEHIDISKDIIIEVCDMTGRLILKSHNQQKINVSCLVHGIYILKIKTGNQTYSEKFVKK